MPPIDSVIFYPTPYVLII